LERAGSLARLLFLVPFGRPMDDNAQKPQTGTPSNPPEELPYSIDLWPADRRETPERVLARASSLQLARAIFKAAATEFPERRVTLREGTRIISDSSI
jgi:hypothetical protein